MRVIGGVVGGATASMPGSAVGNNNAPLRDSAARTLSVPNNDPSVPLEDA